MADTLDKPKKLSAHALSAYRAKRDFSKTPEPSGNNEENATTSHRAFSLYVPTDAAQGETRGAYLNVGEYGESEAKRCKHLNGKCSSFVVQKHAASHLHYDFRLEMGGVLKSWAVAKGPSINPEVRRLAAHVEDHPLSYGGFEGIIPKGQYGGGTVMLWDYGMWEPLGDAEAMYKAGKMVFNLHGQRMKGRWHLVRMRDKQAEEQGKRPGGRAHDNWLLIKGHDGEAKPEEGDFLTSHYQESATTHRTMEVIAREKAAIWQSKTAEPLDFLSEKTLLKLPSARKIPMPIRVSPALATLVSYPPNGDEWLHEIKFDGYRMLSHIRGGEIKIITRNGNDWTDRFPTIVNELKLLPVENAILDGEMVVLNLQGVSDFKALQNMLELGENKRLDYFLFDLLYINGIDLRITRLIERKMLLKQLIAATKDGDLLHFSDHVTGKGEAFFNHSCHFGLEGSIAKQANSSYQEFRTKSWLKIKCDRRQEFVIGGYKPAKHEERGIGALSLGYYEGDKLIYVCKVGTGFTDREGSALAAKLDAIRQDAPPFSAVSTPAKKDMLWVKPELVAEVTFLEWTHDGALRHPSFVSLREDRDPKTVGREKTQEPEPPSPPKRAKGRTPKLSGITISHPERIMYPDKGYTKGEVAEYYDSVAQWLLPHIIHRPLSIIRCPQSTAEHCFFQRHKNRNFPDAVKEVPVTLKDGKTEHYLTITDKTGLLSLVQMGVVEFHPWEATEDALEMPDRIIWDLDPDPTVPWEKVVEAAFSLRKLLQHHKLTSFVKTTGGKGLHVVIPIVPEYGWETVKLFAKYIGAKLQEEHPAHFTLNMSKAGRKGKIFIDYLRNDKTSTAIAPYSLRARPGAPVAMPLTWKQLEKGVNPLDYTLKTVPGLMESGKDAWAKMGELRQGIKGFAG